MDEIFYVYILFSEKCHKYYVGHTHALDIRVTEHNSGKGGEFSSACKPWKLMYSEKLNSRSAAMKREREIKRKKSRSYIEWLIAAAR
jgi:putative endonuclease